MNTWQLVFCTPRWPGLVLLLQLLSELWGRAAQVLQLERAVLPPQIVVHWDAFCLALRLVHADAWVHARYHLVKQPLGGEGG